MTVGAPNLNVSLAPGAVPAAGGQPPLGERLAATPRHACQTLARALSAGELEAALACFLPDACLIAPDGTAAHGTAAIRPHLARLIASGAGVAIELAGVLAAGDVALAHERWSACSGGEGGFSYAPQPTLVLRRTGEGWRIAIAAPWGLAPAPPLEAVAF